MTSKDFDNDFMLANYDGTFTFMISGRFGAP